MSDAKRFSLTGPPPPQTTSRASRRESVVKSGRAGTSTGGGLGPLPEHSKSPSQDVSAGKSAIDLSGFGMSLAPPQQPSSHRSNQSSVSSDASSVASPFDIFDPLASGPALAPAQKPRDQRSNSAWVGTKAPAGPAASIDLFSQQFQQQANVDPFAPQSQSAAMAYEAQHKRTQSTTASTAKSAAPPAADPFGAPSSDPFGGPAAAAPGGANPFDQFDMLFSSPAKPAAAAPAASSGNKPAAAASTGSGAKAASPGKKKKEESESEEEESSEESDSDDSESEEEGKPSKKKKPAAAADKKPKQQIAELADNKSNDNNSNTNNNGSNSLAIPGPKNARSASVPHLPHMQVDVLAYMKKGTPFLKYGKHGYPHFRQFQLSDDHAKIVWFSQSKKLKDTQIDLHDVNEIRLGQTTPVFQRHKAPELAKSSFSVIYANRSQTLDLIAKDPNEYKIWTAGLQELVRRCKMGKFDGLDKLVIDVPVVGGRRSSIEIVDFNTGKNAAQVFGSAEDAAAHKAPDTGIHIVLLHPGNKQMYKDVARNFQRLKHKLAKRRDELRQQEYYMSPAFENMGNIVKRVQDSIVKINDWFQDGEYGLCDDEIWRAGVDLESLKNMMAAVRG